MFYREYLQNFISDMRTLKKIVYLGKIQKRTGQTVNFICYNNINLPGLNISKKHLKSRAVHVSSGKTAVIVMLVNNNPAIMFLTFYVGFA